MGDDELNGPGGERPQAHDELDDQTHDQVHEQGHDELADERERQARETMQVIRESAGELGTRVRRVLDHAATLWDATSSDADVNPKEHAVSLADVIRARALARRWKAIDFLVDPELSEGMAVTRMHDGAAWHIEVRERGETRLLSEATEPYRGAAVPGPAPVLLAWEYTFPTPEIESGERRERLGDSGMIGACLRCNGTGHRPCRHCEGKGFVQCPTCHGRARVICRRCRGRGRIADPQAERRARSSKSYFQVHAERLATDAAGRLADLSERLRQEHGIPLPPSGEWLPTAPASGETLPCPDCADGKVACGCGNGKLVCDSCRGSGHASCGSCAGSGRVVRFREVVRRFDLRRSTQTRTLDAALTKLMGSSGQSALARAPGDEIWHGSVEQLAQPSPAGVPADVWSTAQDLAREHAAQAARLVPSRIPPPTGTGDEQSVGQGERRVIGRQVRLTRVPLTQVEYTFAGHPFAFLAVGQRGAERFWAETFPPRWSRVHRFVKALVRDLEELSGEFTALPGPADVTLLDEYRARRARNGTSNGASHGTAIQRVRIVEEPEEGAAPPPEGPRDERD
ncbi:MAG TPA: hypothetical protein VF120_08770 [Ktedonobacterales bacterium]